MERKHQRIRKDRRKCWGRHLWNISLCYLLLFLCFGDFAADARSSVQSSTVRPYRELSTENATVHFRLSSAVSASRLVTVWQSFAFLRRTAVQRTVRPVKLLSRERHSKGFEKIPGSFSFTFPGSSCCKQPGQRSSKIARPRQRNIRPAAVFFLKTPRKKEDFPGWSLVN